MKKLVATTATALLLGTGAFADAHMAAGVGVVQVDAADLFASDVIGARVYASDRPISMDGGTFNQGDGWDDIGEINDLVVSIDGELPAAIIGVGGFLGIGEKDVAISMDQIALYTDESGERFLVTTASAEVLGNAPAFDMALDGEATAAAELTDTAATQAEPEQIDTATEVATMDAAPEPEATETETAAAEDAPMVGDATLFDGYAPVMLVDLTAEQLQGARVYDTMNNDIGEIATLVLSTDGMVTDAVVDVGGFLGLGEKPVLLNFDALEILKEADGDDLVVRVSSTQEELEAMPEYTE